MGNFLSDAWKATKKGVVDAGHFVGKVASNPIVQGGISLIPGAGIPVAALTGALGGALKPGGGLKGAVGGGLKGAASGAVAGQIAKLPGVSGVLGKIGGAAGKIPGVSNVADFLGKDVGGYLKEHIPGMGALGAGGAGGGGPSGLEQFLGGGDGIGMNDIAKMGILGLSGAQLLNANRLGEKADKYAMDAMGSVTDSYKQRAPLRVAGIEGMLNPRTADLSGLLRNSGPYAKGLPAPIAPQNVIRSTPAGAPGSARI